MDFSMALHVPGVPDNVKRLLVIRQSALGDIVNALYSLRSIRAAYPSAHVTWVVDDRFRELFDAVEGVDEVIVFPRRRWGPWLSRPWRWPQLALEWNRYKRSLREMEFDLAVDLHGNSKSRLTLKSIRVRDVCRYNRGPAPELNDLSVVNGIRCRPADPARDLRASQFRGRLLEAGVRPLSAPFPWRIPEESARIVEEHLQREGLARGAFAVLHPGSSDFGLYKRWPAERFSGLAARLSQSGTPVVVAWGPGERELAGRVVEAAGKDGAGVRLAPETRPLSVLIALLARAGVFVGNDSGPLHIASACGTPTVGLYGPKDPSVYAPYSPPRAVLYHPLPCSPCGKRRCENPECMKALSVDAVAEATLALVRDRTDKPFQGVPLRGRKDRIREQPRLAVDAQPPDPGPCRYFTAGAWHWTVVAGEAGPMADAAMRSAEGLPGTPVQENPRRRFLRLSLPRFESDGSIGATGRKAFVKVFPVRSIAQRLRFWLGCSQAEVEFGRLIRLHARGAPVPAPVALGRGPGCEAVVLEDLGETPTVRDRLGGGLDAAARRLLLDKVAMSVADLHAAGFVHEDLHIGNILELTDGSVRILDLQRGTLTGSPAVEGRAVTLAHLFLSLDTFTGVQERYRLLRRYSDRAGLDRRARQELALAVNRRLGRLRLRHVMGQIRRSREGGSRVWIGPWRDGRARASFGARDWLEAEEAVDAVVKDEAGRRVLKVRKAGKVLAIKEEGRRPRGLRAWAGAHGWLAAGLPTPTPYFLVEPRSGAVRLATGWVEGAEPSNAWIEERLRGGAGLSWRRETAWRLGRLVRRLHDRGVYHADLKAGNVLAREGSGGGAEFTVLDLDRVTFHPEPVQRAEAMANLAQLNAAFAPPVTRTDRLRCFLAYATRDPVLRRGWKDAVRELMRRTAARRHRWP
jgi:heptosyltransferase I